MHLNEYLASLAGLWPAMKEKVKKENSCCSSSVPAAATEATTTATATTAATAMTATTVETTAHLAKPRDQQSLSLRDGLLGAGVGEAMMGVADAGYANTVGAALEDTSLMGTCFLEHEWDVDGDRTFVLKVRKVEVMVADPGDKSTLSFAVSVYERYTSVLASYSTGPLIRSQKSGPA